MPAIVTDVESIREIIREATREAVRDVLPSLVREATTKPWLTKGELKELTGWSDRTIQHLRDTHQIPFSQHGRKILYPSEGIRQFLALQSVRPRTSASRQATEGSK